MNKVSGNPKALRAHKEASLHQTRQYLELALKRLENNNPSRVKPGTPITASSVAEEAGIDRSTLYRYHDPILTEIRKLNNVTPKKQLQAKRGELAETLARMREYREALKESRAEMTAWARQNYALSHRAQELEELVRQRDIIIKELHAQLREVKKVAHIKTLSQVKEQA